MIVCMLAHRSGTLCCLCPHIAQDPGLGQSGPAAAVTMDPAPGKRSGDGLSGRRKIPVRRQIAGHTCRFGPVTFQRRVPDHQDMIGGVTKRF